MFPDNIRVLWKLPKDRHHKLPKDLPTDKFRIEHWVSSQISVLLHPNVKVGRGGGGGGRTDGGNVRGQTRNYLFCLDQLFVSHAGGNGYHEAVISLPFFSSFITLLIYPLGICWKAPACSANVDRLL